MSRFSDMERDYIARMVQTEADHRLRYTDFALYQQQIRAIVQVTVNRMSADGYPNTVQGVLNQPMQFTRINGPARWDPYGSIENTPVADEITQELVDNAVTDAESGNTGPAGNALHFGVGSLSDSGNNRDRVNSLPLVIGTVRFGNSDGEFIPGSNELGDAIGNLLGLERGTPVTPHARIADANRRQEVAPTPHSRISRSVSAPTPQPRTTINRFGSDAPPIPAGIEERVTARNMAVLRRGQNALTPRESVDHGAQLMELIPSHAENANQSQMVGGLGLGGTGQFAEQPNDSSGVGGAIQGLGNLFDGVQTSPRRLSEAVEMRYQTREREDLTPHGNIRNQPLTPELEANINAAMVGFPSNVRAYITSGGQDSADEPNARRTGSTRHDHGEAADIRLQENGVDLPYAGNEGLYDTLGRNLAATGLTGIGFGNRGSFIHAGGGDPATWGYGPFGRGSKDFLLDRQATAVRFGQQAFANGLGPEDFLPQPQSRIVREGDESLTAFQEALTGGMGITPKLTAKQRYAIADTQDTVQAPTKRRAERQKAKGKASTSKQKTTPSKRKKAKKPTPAPRPKAKAKAKTKAKTKTKARVKLKPRLKPKAKLRPKSKPKRPKASKGGR